MSINTVLLLGNVPRCICPLPTCMKSICEQKSKHSSMTSPNVNIPQLQCVSMYLEVYLSLSVNKLLNKLPLILLCLSRIDNSLFDGHVDAKTILPWSNSRNYIGFRENIYYFMVDPNSKHLYRMSWDTYNHEAQRALRLSPLQSSTNSHVSLYSILPLTSIFPYFPRHY